MERKLIGSVFSLVLAAGLCGWGTPAWAVSDGFGDGDRNNDGVLDGPGGTGTVDDAGDIGLPWWKINRLGDAVVVEVRHDPGGLGDDNALIVDVLGEQQFQAANFPTISLVNPGDAIKLSFSFRFQALVDNRDTFRFSLSNDAGTPITADVATGFGTATDDSGYVGTIATGAVLNRARIAGNRPSTGSASILGIDETIDGEDPSPKIINDNGPHTAALTIIRSTSGTVIAKMAIDGTEYFSGQDTTPNTFDFNEVAFGCVPVPPLDYTVDDVLIEAVTVPVCEAIPPVAADPPLGVGATTVTVLGLGTAAELVKVYANGTEIGSAVGAPPTTPPSLPVTVPALVAGQSITATQVVNGIEGCVIGEAFIVGNCADVPAVGLAPGFEEGSTSVTVTNVDATATSVTVYSGTTSIGTAPAAGGATVSVTLTRPLTRGERIGATQTLAGVEGCIPSPGLIVRGGTLTVLVDDGFGDGDRDNDGVLDPPPAGSVAADDPADVGAAWRRITMGNQANWVGHDIGALGDDNAMFIDSSATQAYQVARFTQVSLAEAGDYIRMSFDVRLVGTPPSYRDVLRFGLFNDLGTTVDADQANADQVRDDEGYFATIPTGAPAAGLEDGRIARAGTPGTAAGTLFGLDSTLQAVDPYPVIMNDNNLHQASMLIQRTDVARVLIQVTVDGVVRQNYEYAPTGAQAPITAIYNQVGFGQIPSSGQPQLDYALDNIKVVAGLNPCADPVFNQDRDEDVDSVDLGVFANCATGPAPATGTLAAMSQLCQCMDANLDDAVDMNDFALFQKCFTAAGNAIDPACDD